jgi:hypothetical protein
MHCILAADARRCYRATSPSYACEPVRTLVLYLSGACECLPVCLSACLSAFPRRSRCVPSDGGGPIRCAGRSRGVPSDGGARPNDATLERSRSIVARIRRRGGASGAPRPRSDPIRRAGGRSMSRSFIRRTGRARARARSEAGQAQAGENHSGRDDHATSIEHHERHMIRSDDLMIA